MTVTTSSNREIGQDTSRAKKAARNGPVFIIDSGRPAHVPADNAGLSHHRRTTDAD